MRIVTISKQYPNPMAPTAALFVERRLLEVMQGRAVEAKVVSPIPWLPRFLRRQPRAAKLIDVPYREQRRGIDVSHPRYWLIPKIGMTLHPLGMAIACYAELRKLRREGYDFDVIDAHFFYPDGVAAALLSKWLDRPFVVTVRGSDISQFATYRLPRRMIRWAAQRCSGIVAVCQALKDQMLVLGLPEQRMTVLRNGVDLQQFSPVDREEARARLSLPAGPLLVSVGGLIERKGHHHTIAALTLLPEWRLVLVGAGEKERALRQLAQREGVADRVIFAGERPPQDLKYFYSAADASVLASSREGWANVLLESMACGTPVVATAIWGTPEVVQSDAAGVLVSEQTPRALAEGVRRLWADYPARTRTREYAEGFAWAPTAQGQWSIYETAIREWRQHRGPSLPLEQTMEKTRL